MRKMVWLLSVLASLLLVPSASASVSVSVSPTSVDFGRVPFKSGCFLVNDVPNEFCVTRTLTVTNTGTETMFESGARSCEYFLQPNSCLTLHADWGGIAGPNTSTCLSGITIAPGESCTVILVAIPSRPGLIRGFFVGCFASTSTDEAVILVVPIRLLAVPS